MYLDLNAHIKYSAPGGKKKKVLCVSVLTTIAVTRELVQHVCTYYSASTNTRLRKPREVQTVALDCHRK